MFACAQTGHRERLSLYVAALVSSRYREFTMQTKFVKPVEGSHGRKFADMTRLQKVVFVAKVVACVATFGFAFPNVQNE